jgi:MFS family permease
MRALFIGRPDLRRFFLAYAQSQLGTGAAFVALVLIAYTRLHSPWAVTLVLLADFLPGIVLGPFFGALADRLPRKQLAVGGDIVRACAFIAIALIPSFTATVAFALLAGVGSSMAGPAVNSALPGLVKPEQRSAATALYGSLSSIGITVGPGLAAVLLLAVSPTVILGLNGLTFVISALMIAGVDLGHAQAEDENDLGSVWVVSLADAGLGYIPVEEEETDQVKTSVWEDIKEGVAATSQLPGILIFLLINAATVLAAAMMNVAEPLLAIGPLHAGKSGYSILVSAYGVGMIAAAFINARAGTSILSLRKRWLLGIAIDGAAMIATALAPDLEVALFTFALTGLGNVLLIGPEMRIIQELVSERLLGRVFSLRDVLTNTCFVVAFLIAGAVLTFLGSRDIFWIGGIFTLVLTLAAASLFHPQADPNYIDTTLLEDDLSYRRRDPRYQPRHHHW